MRPLRPVLRAGAAGVLAATLAVPAAATAGVLSHADPGQDLQKITVTRSSTTVTNAPTVKNGDIVHLTARYGTKRLLEKLRLRGLSGRWLMTSRITDGPHHFDLTVVHQVGTLQANLSRGKDHTVVPCAGLVPEVDATDHTVSVTIPADCLATPPWVRISTGMIRFAKAGGVSYADDAQRRRGVTEANLTLSKKIHQN